MNKENNQPKSVKVSQRQVASGLEKSLPKGKEVSSERKGRLMKGMVSGKADKTVVVSVSRLKKHPKYKKRYKVTEKYKAHDEKNEYKIGDKVIIQETRPMSKEKRWRVVNKL